MQRSRSLATAAGVTLAVAGAVSALFLTMGAGASILSLGDSPSTDSSSTVPTPGTTGTIVDDLPDAEVYTLDENGRLVPFDDRDSTGAPTSTVPARDDRYDHHYKDDDHYDHHEEDHDEDDHHEDDHHEEGDDD